MANKEILPIETTPPWKYLTPNELSEEHKAGTDISWLHPDAQKFLKWQANKSADDPELKKWAPSNAFHQTILDNWSKDSYRSFRYDHYLREQANLNAFFYTNFGNPYGPNGSLLKDNAEYEEFKLENPDIDLNINFYSNDYVYLPEELPSEDYSQSTIEPEETLTKPEAVIVNDTAGGKLTSLSQSQWQRILPENLTQEQKEGKDDSWLHPTDRKYADFFFGFYKITVDTKYTKKELFERLSKNYEETGNPWGKDYEMFHKSFKEGTDDKFAKQIYDKFVEENPTVDLTAHSNLYLDLPDELPDVANASGQAAFTTPEVSWVYTPPGNLTQEQIDGNDTSWLHPDDKKYADYLIDKISIINFEIREDPSIFYKHLVSNYQSSGNPWGEDDVDLKDEYYDEYIKENPEAKVNFDGNKYTEASLPTELPEDIKVTTYPTYEEFSEEDIKKVEEAAIKGEPVPDVFKEHVEEKNEEGIKQNPEDNWIDRYIRENNIGGPGGKISLSQKEEFINHAHKSQDSNLTKDYIQRVSIKDGTWNMGNTSKFNVETWNDETDGIAGYDSETAKFNIKLFKTDHRTDYPTFASGELEENPKYNQKYTKIKCNWFGLNCWEEDAWRWVDDTAKKNANIKMDEINTTLNSDNTKLNAKNLERNKQLYNLKNNVVATTKGEDYLKQRDKLTGTNVDEEFKLDNIFRDYYKNEKIQEWDGTRLGRKPTYGEFQVDYYLANEPTGQAQSIWDEAEQKDDIDITLRYGNKGNYALWDYTSQNQGSGIFDRVRANAPHEYDLADTYLESPTTKTITLENGNKISTFDFEKEQVQKLQLGLNDAQNQVQSLLGRYDPETKEYIPNSGGLQKVRDEYEKARSITRDADGNIVSEGDEYWNALGKEHYLDPSDPEEFTYLFRLSEKEEHKAIPLVQSLNAGQGITELDDAINRIVGSKQQAEVKKFGQMTQSVLEDTIEKLKEVRKREEFIDTISGFGTFGQIFDVNKTLTQTILGDTGVGGYLNMFGGAKAEDSLEKAMGNVTGISNSFSYNWQKWYDEELVNKYGPGYADFVEIKRKEDLIKAFESFSLNERLKGGIGEIVNRTKYKEWVEPLIADVKEKMNNNIEDHPIIFESLNFPNVKKYMDGELSWEDLTIQERDTFRFYNRTIDDEILKEIIRLDKEEPEKLEEIGYKITRSIYDPIKKRFRDEFIKLTPFRDNQELLDFLNKKDVNGNTDPNKQNILKLLTGKSYWEIKDSIEDTDNFEIPDSFNDQGGLITISNLKNYNINKRRIINRHFEDEGKRIKFELNTGIEDDPETDINESIEEYVIEDLDFGRRFIDDYLKVRFDTSRSMNEFIEYLDVRQEEQNPFQTQDLLNAVKMEAEFQANSWLNKIKGDVKFDSEFYLNPTTSDNDALIDIEDPSKGTKNELYKRQEKRIKEDWDRAKEDLNNLVFPDDPESDTWGQVFYRYGETNVNDPEIFAKLHYQQVGNRLNFDGAADALNPTEIRNYIYNVLAADDGALSKAAGSAGTVFGDFITPEEFANDLLEGLDPADTEAWKEALKQVGLEDFEGTIEELKEYIKEIFTTGSAYEIRQHIKYLNEKRKRPTQQNLGLSYIERAEDFKDERVEANTELFKTFQSAGYEGTEDEFYDTFFPDISMEDQKLLTSAGKDSPLGLTNFDFDDPFAALGTLSSFLEDDESDTDSFKATEFEKKLKKVEEDDNFFTFRTEDDWIYESPSKKKKDSSTFGSLGAIWEGF